MKRNMIDSVVLREAIKMLNVLADAHDPSTKDHSRRTRDIAVRIGHSLGIGGLDLTYLDYAADVHDVGKIGIPTDIIRSTAQLTIAERASIQTHSKTGSVALEKGGISDFIVKAVLYHHEHWDGSGYPDKLEGLEIPLAARIICIADVWDALLSERPYRPALSFVDALETMNKNINWFDPQIYAVWIKLAREDSGY